MSKKNTSAFGNASYQIQLALPRATRTRILFQPETEYCLLPRAINSITES